jgi:hypothetical protein
VTKTGGFGTNLPLAKPLVEQLTGLVRLLSQSIKLRRHDIGGDPKWAHFGQPHLESVRISAQGKRCNGRGTKIGPRSRTKVVLDEKSSNLILYFIGAVQLI